MRSYTAADKAQEAAVVTAEFTTRLAAMHVVEEPANAAVVDAEETMARALQILETAKAFVVDGHPKNVTRAEKSHEKVGPADIARHVIGCYLPPRNEQ